MQEEKIANAVHSIAQVAGIADEQMVRKAAIGEIRDRWGTDLVKMKSFINDTAFDMKEARAKLGELASALPLENKG
jgi:hypothetical protein